MGKFSQYKVQLSSLADGHYEQDFILDTQFFKNMERDDIQQADVKAHLDLTKKHDAYQMVFTCRGAVQVPCDRCLDPLVLDIDTGYSLTVKYGPEYNDDQDDVLVIPYDDTFLNVAYILADTVLLAVPLRHVHAPGKCNKAMSAVLHKHRGATDLASEILDEAEGETDNEIETPEPEETN